MTEHQFRTDLAKAVTNEIAKSPDALAAWEGGSAANKTSDQYSDLDLCVLVNNPSSAFIEHIEYELNKINPIAHVWNISKQPYGKGVIKKIYILANAPKYFYVDLSVFNILVPEIFKSFMEIERHGNPIIYFDKNDHVRPQPINSESILKQQKNRIDEITQSFPIYKTIVLKEIDRGNAIDAMAFYHNGLVRPLSELLGIIYRPLQFDFNLRYFHRAFPKELQELVQGLCYVEDLEDLRRKIIQAEEEFFKAIKATKEISFTP
ncbi:MAG: nucleotidyltransferase domain-containing protein [Bdellovibrio sp.]